MLSLSRIDIMKDYLLALRNTYTNWRSLAFHMLLFKLGIRKKRTFAILKDGRKIHTGYQRLLLYAMFSSCYKSEKLKEYLNSYYKLKDFEVKIECEDSELIKEGIISLNYKDERRVLLKTMYSSDGKILKLAFPDLSALREYSSLNVEDSVVIDVGAFIGESSIYFSIKGAKDVIGLEPIPSAYKLAWENVRLNKLNNVMILNAGYGKDNIVRIEDREASNLNELKIATGGGVNIRVLSLKSIIKSFNLDSERLVLKMDCEGCEYDILNEDKDDLKKIKEMVIEYHYGPEKLVEKLEEVGFKVKYTGPKNVYNTYVTNPYMKVGYIFAYQ